MTQKRRLLNTEETVKRLEQGILDDTILYLSDDELRRELAAYRPLASPEDAFDASIEVSDGSALLMLSGALSPTTLSKLQNQLDQLVLARPKKITVDMSDLTSITAEGIQAFAAASEQFGPDVVISVVDATGKVRQVSSDTSLGDVVKLAETARPIRVAE